MIFTVLTDGVLKASASPLKIIYTCIWYIVCTFLVFAVHDFVQQQVAKALGDKSICPSCNPLKQMNRYENWISAAELVLFWTGWKSTAQTSELSRPKKMVVALCGPLTCGILCIPAYTAMWAVGNFSVPDALSTPFTALFTVSLMIGISCLFFLPPCDGGTFLAQLLPWDLRDKFVQIFDNHISMLLFIITAALMTQQGITRIIFESGFSFFGNLWFAVFGG